jgi:uncharacterized protein with von Willebrand factor type A (vWA) domain
MSFLQDLIDKGKDLIGWGEAKPPSETEAVKRDSFDRADYQRVLDTAPTIEQMQRHLEKTVDYAAAFMADLHAGLFKVDPQVRSAEEMAPTHVANAAVMDTLLNTPEMQALRMHTQGDAYTSAIGMIAMQNTTLEALTAAHDAAKAEAKAEEQRQEAREKRQKEIEELLKDLAENPPPPPLPEGEEGPERAPDPRVDGLKTQLDEFGQMPVPSNAGVQEAAEQAAAGMDRKLRKQAKKVTEELDEEMALMSAFGVEPGQMQRMSVHERMKLATKLKNNRLAAFAKLLGQFRMVQEAESRKRVTDAASEVHGITTGNDLTRMTSSELLNFADVGLETLMWARWSEDQLSIWDVRGRENMGQGPIICVVDESGSMNATDVVGGTREAWSKALSLALLEQAKHRKRDFTYIGFSSAGRQRVVEFPGGETPIEKVIEMTEGFLSGGTNFEQPLRLALTIMEEQFDALQKPRPDIVMITDDAYGPMDANFMAEWNRVKDKTSLKCYGIAVGCEAGGSLKAISDNVRSVTSLLDSDPRSVGDLFRTI